MTTDHMDEATRDIPSGSPFWQYARKYPDINGGITPDGSATGAGSCGDTIRFDIKIRDDVLVDIGVTPDGCVFTHACAGAAAALVLGRTIDQALEVLPEDVAAELGGLPEDHMHCARLAVNTLGQALADCYRKSPSVPRERVGPRGRHRPFA